MGEARLLPAEGHYGDEPQPGEGIAQFEHRLGGGQVEAYGHAAEERPETMGMKPADGGGKRGGSLAAIGTVARESHGCARIGNHVPKGNNLARTLQLEGLNQINTNSYENTGIVIASLVGGMIIGSALTMLFTPQSGAELRKQIKDLIGDEVDKVREKVDEVRGKVEEARCKCEEK